MIRLVILFFICVCVMCAQVTLDFGPVAVNQTVQGVPIPASVSGKISLQTQGNNALIDTTFLLDLTGLQGAIGTLVAAAGNKNDDCNQIIRLHTTRLMPSGTAASVFVAGHFEQWSCPWTYIPLIGRVNGGKHKLFEQNGDATVSVQPTITSNGAELGFNISPGAIHADGLLGGLLSNGLTGPWLRDVLTQQVLSGLDKNNLKASFPAEILAYSPKIKSANFKDLGGGKLGFTTTMSLTVTSAQANDLFHALQKRYQSGH